MGVVAFLSLLSFGVIPVPQSSSARKADPPVLEVSVETSLGGRISVQKRELENLFMSALENAGIQKDLVFVSRDRGGDRYGVDDRDTSGYYEKLPGGERGRFVRPTHRVKLTFVVERNVEDEYVGSSVSGILKNLPLEMARDLLAESRKITETVSVQMRVNVFDAMRGVSVQSVPTIHGEGKSEIYRARNLELSHTEYVTIWIFTFPRRAVDHKFEQSKRKLSSELRLTTGVLDGVAVNLADQLASAMKAVRGDQVPATEPTMSVESMAADRRSVVIVGELGLLHVGDILIIPVVDSEVAAKVGGDRTVFGTVVQKDGNVAVANIVEDISTMARSAIPERMRIDTYRPVRRMKSLNGSGSRRLGPHLRLSYAREASGG